jgi:methionyl-tRNA synthetase
MPWGIPVPNDPQHVMYVWFDALTNYISTLGWPNEGGDFEKFWKNGTPTQYCGKDNTRFQAGMWQAMLMAAGVPNSNKIVVNGFVTGEGGVKMSKSLGNVVNPLEIINEYGTEALRYFVAREISTFEDSPFTMERFRDSYNSGLANGLGNLVSRIMKMAETHLTEAPRIPEHSIPDNFKEAINNFEIGKACEIIWGKIGELDRKIQETKPFSLVKTDPEKAKEIIRELVVELYTVGRMLNPIMPEANMTIKALVKANRSPEKPLFVRKDA